MKKPNKEKMIEQIRREALRENYVKSLQVSKKLLGRLENYFVWFLKVEEATEQISKRSKIVDIKNITNDESMMERCAAVEAVKYLIETYQLMQKKGEDQ
jgi:hypothetical protein